VTNSRARRVTFTGELNKSSLDLDPELVSDKADYRIPTEGAWMHGQPSPPIRREAVPEYKCVAENSFFKGLIFGVVRGYYKFSHDEVEMVKAAADPVAALCALVQPYGPLASVGVIAAKALITILNQYHGNNGIIISYPLLGSVAPIPLTHNPSSWETLT
jgi:hypothetical protein